ncbi:MAG: NAD(P)H-hydrate dehydratase [Muribaculaceae bacterium]|nr:NAD(P)H-hydrate dehydratase [Muribaculaceae bacterium]
MNLFSPKQIHEIDNATCHAQGIDSLELMERAASAVSVELMSRFLPGQRFVVVAGPGNNGGDALAVARQLIEQGYRKVEIFLFNVTERLSHDCDEMRKKLITMEGVDFTEVTKEFSPPYLSENDVVVDGLFGIGLQHALSGGFQALASLINESGAFVVSIDIPSGLFSEWNTVATHREMVHADLTLTFQFPKLSFMFAENAPVIGEWKVLDIDLDSQKIKETPTEFKYVEGYMVRSHLRKRNPFTGKRDYGSALLMAGSKGMMGAAVMASRAALKSGCGLVTVHSAAGGYTILQTAVPEAMFEPDRNDNYITDMNPHHAHQVVAVGPGIGTHQLTIDALEHLLKNSTTPLLLDADALNCIAKRPALLTALPPYTIITPHAGEFDRLFGEHPNDEARLRKAIEMAKYHKIIIVLKGHYTACVRPGGKVFFNSTGNPGMATAGAGDVLTGVIAAFMAQGMRPEIAASVGVYIHGLAGDLAAREIGEYGVTATDIASYVGRAVAETANI